MLVGFLLATGVLFRDLGKLFIDVILYQITPAPAPRRGPNWADTLEKGNQWAPDEPYLSWDSKWDTWWWFKKHPLGRIVQRIDQEEFELQITVTRSLIEANSREGLYFSWQTHPETYGTLPYFKGLLSGRYTANNQHWIDICQYADSGSLHLIPLYSIHEEYGEVFHFAQYYY